MGIGHRPDGGGMHSTYTIQLAVERSPGGLVVHAAGELTGATGARLLTLLGNLARPGRAVFVDLAQIRTFDTDGIAALRRAADAGVELHLTGVADRRALLPGDVAGMLDGFDVVATVEQARPAQRPRLVAVATA